MEERERDGWEWVRDWGEEMGEMGPKEMGTVWQRRVGSFKKILFF